MKTAWKLLVFIVRMFVRDDDWIQNENGDGGEQMARRKKNMTYAEELQFVESEIEKAENTLKELKARKKELAQKKEEEELKMLYDRIKASGKTVSEYLEGFGE